MNNVFSNLERQRQILQFIARNQRVTLTEVREIFNVSEATARRDLELLAEQGRLQRVHGGAIAIVQAPPESPILDRQDEQAESKRRIGQAAAQLVKDGETVFLGSGTTVLTVARALREHKNLTIITNSLPVMTTLSDTGHTLISLGGLFRQSEQSFIGHITEQALAEVHADKVIIGTRAISLERGLTNDYMPETMTDRATLQAGREVIIVADHTKFGRVATIMLAPIESVHMVVTDPETPQEFIERVRERGINVVIA
jgi:DeoR family transcriptional regulator, aga operon transcriptional repressor